MFIYADVYKGKRLVSRRCPNVGRACNCTGACRPILVDEADERLDEEIIAEYNRVEKQYKEFTGITLTKDDDNDESQGSDGIG